MSADFWLGAVVGALTGALTMFVMLWILCNDNPEDDHEEPI